MFKKITAIALAVMMMVSMMAIGSVSASAESSEVFANQFYMAAMWGDFETWQIWGLSIFGQGTINNGILSAPVITDPADERNGGNYMVTDMMVFTFAQPTTVASMTFVANADGQFPTDYQIQYRDAAYYSEAHGFTGNPTAMHIAGGENWPVTEGFGPEGGLPYEEVSRDGATVTINLDMEMECVAILIQATTKGSTPWSCKEAHFYGEVSDTPAPSDPSEEPTPSEPAAEAGDVTADGKINASDATRVLLSAVGKVELTDAQATAADVNGDDKVNAVDASRILLYSVGKITAF